MLVLSTFPTCKRYMKKFLTAFLLYTVMVVLTGTCVYLCWFIFQMGRTGLIDWAVQLLQKKHIQGKIETIYTTGNHTIIKILSAVLVAGVGMIWFLLLRNRKKVINWLYHFIFTSIQIILSFFKHSVPENSFVRYSLFTIIFFAVCRSIYYIVTVPVSFDEADTWLLFISKGPVMISSFYPFPNNHIFYNWCVWFCSFLPFNTTVLLRLPLIPALPVCIIFIYRLAKHLFNEQASLLSVAVFTFSFPVLHYSYTARGYLFILLFALITLWCLVMLHERNKKRYRLALVCSLVAGFYTVPSYLYFAVPVLVFFFVKWLVEDTAKAKLLIKYAMVAAMIVFLLYTPVFLVSGTGSLLHSYGKQFTSNEMGSMLQLTLLELNKHLFGRSAPAMITGNIIFLFLLLYGFGTSAAKRWFFLLCFINCALPIFIFFVQKQPFPARAWIHLLVFVSLAVCTIGLMVKNRVIVVVITLLIIAFRFYPQFSQYHLHVMGYDQFAKQIATRMVAEKRNTLYINKNYIKPLFDFYFQSSHFPAAIYLQKGLYRSDEFDATVKYSAIIWSKNDPANQLLKFPYDTVLVHKDLIVLFAK